MSKFDTIRNRIGYQALFEERDFHEAIDFATARGLGAVEVNLTSPSFSPGRYSPEEREKIRVYCEEKGMPLLVHAPEGLNFLNPQDTVREACLRRMGELLRFSSEIGARRFTFHLGYCEPLSVGGRLVRLYELYPRVYEEMAEEVLTHLTDLYRDAVVLCLENCGGFRYGVVEKVLKRILPSSDLHLTWDLGHTNRLEGEKRDREESLFSEFLDRVGNCHLHDNSGNWDEHNVVGKGTVDFPRYLNMLADLDTYFILEVRPRERALLSLNELENLMGPTTRSPAHTPEE